MRHRVKMQAGIYKDWLKNERAKTDQDKPYRYDRFTPPNAFGLINGFAIRMGYFLGPNLLARGIFRPIPPNCREGVVEPPLLRNRIGLPLPKTRRTAVGVF